MGGKAVTQKERNKTRTSLGDADKLFTLLGVAGADDTRLSVGEEAAVDERFLLRNLDDEGKKDDTAKKLACV